MLLCLGELFGVFATPIREYFSENAVHFKAKCRPLRNFSIVCYSLHIGRLWQMVNFPCVSAFLRLRHPIPFRAGDGGGHGREPQASV